MLFTVKQIKNGIGMGWNSVNLEDFAKKVDVPTKQEFNVLAQAMGDKLDKSPPHNHEITEIIELANTLNNKLDSTKKYNYSSLLSNPEAIEFLTTLKTTKLKIANDESGSYYFDVDSVGDLRLIHNDVVIANYDSTNSKWIIGGIDIKDVLENHTEAINRLTKN